MIDLQLLSVHVRVYQPDLQSMRRSYGSGRLLSLLKSMVRAKGHLESTEGVKASKVDRMDRQIKYGADAPRMKVRSWDGVSDAFGGFQDTPYGIETGQRSPLKSSFWRKRGTLTLCFGRSIRCSCGLGALVSSTTPRANGTVTFWTFTSGKRCTPTYGVLHWSFTFALAFVLAFSVPDWLLPRHIPRLCLTMLVKIRATHRLQRHSRAGANNFSHRL